MLELADWLEMFVFELAVEEEEVGEELILSVVGGNLVLVGVESETVTVHSPWVVAGEEVVGLLGHTGNAVFVGVFVEVVDGIDLVLAEFGPD